MKNNKLQKNIPDGWKKVQLGDVAIISSGGTPSRKDDSYWNGNIPWITTSEINFNVIKSSKETISQLGLIKSSARIFSKNTLLMAMYGQGKTRGRVALLDIDATTNQACAAIIPNNDLPVYIFYYLLKEYKNIRKISNPGGQKNLSLSLIKTIKLILPSTHEQKLIVSVLETWDQTIEKLAKKIKIKKNIKNGLMQNLLTGKIRLAGFRSRWKQYKLSDICEIKKGQELSKEKLSSNGKYRCILYGELYTKYSELIGDVLSRTNFEEGIISISGDILIPASTTTSAIDLAIAACLNENGVLLGGDINVLRAKKEYDSRFLALYLTHAKKHELARLAQGITIVHLYGKDFKKLNLEIPEIKEQSAIADIFVVADKEIGALKQELEILKDQKKYLLNNLITGKIRVQ